MAWYVSIPSLACTQCGHIVAARACSTSYTHVKPYTTDSISVKELCWWMQMMPNPDFGGSKMHAETYLADCHCFIRMNAEARSDSDVKCFMKLCQDSNARNDLIDQSFQALEPQQYALIPQRHAAWFEIRRRHLATGSRMWGLLLLNYIQRAKRKKTPHSLDSSAFLPEHRSGSNLKHICWCIVV